MTGGGAREVVVLGTSSSVPTRHRNHNGFVLRWDHDAILFDPGEGTQRQLLHTSIRSSSISAIAITHLHGDHCLGLPGVLGRLVLDQRTDPVDLYVPETGLDYIERLCHAAIFDPFPHLRIHPLPMTGAEIDRDGYRLIARPLTHSVDTLGYRVEEGPIRHLDGAALHQAGIERDEVRHLIEAGAAGGGHRPVALDRVSHWSPGQAFAFVMDTAVCDEAIALAADADLVVCESTFLDSDGAFARDFRHLTARQAGWIAAEAGARSLALAHFSARHPDTHAFEQEAGEVFPAVTAARDLDIVPFPPTVPRAPTAIQTHT